VHYRLLNVNRLTVKCALQATEC